MGSLNVMGWVGIAAAVIVAFKAADWIEARAEESRERARKARLVNDKLELELQQMANAANRVENG